jgi:hypothetical protein
MPALTPKDLEDLRFIAAHADIVGYSFVRSEADVRALQSHLSDLGGERLGLVLKIETRRAFEHLPKLLLAMRSPAAGVMIARGNLAVECGYLCHAEDSTAAVESFMPPMRSMPGTAVRVCHHANQRARCKARCDRRVLTTGSAIAPPDEALAAGNKPCDWYA